MNSNNPQHQANDETALGEIEVEGIRNAKGMLQKIYTIWRDFGIDFDQKSHRAKVVWSHVQNLLKDIYTEENSFYEDIKERIDNYTKKIQELSKNLMVTPSQVQGSLIKQEELLRQELDTLTKLKHKRVKSYQDLKTVELKYCQILNLEEHQLPSNTGVPSENDLSELEQHISMLKEEKERRHKKFCKAKKELTTILETTELVPESSLEKDILSGKETLSLTNETFKALEEIISKAQKRKAELEDQRKTLMNKLSVLWQRLKVEESRRVEFLSKHVDCRLSTIKSIEKELERCEKIKRENLESFVTALRRELKTLWDKCYVSEPERQLFYFFSAAEMSDEVLEAHEAEVEKWKKFYADVEHILTKIEKRQKLWDLMIVFEEKAADPNRFKNRRGNLLQEERERKKLQKDLPTLENSIFHDIEAFETENGSPFLYNGEDYKVFVTNQWTDRINQKENEKLERQNKHLQQLGNEVTLGTPAKRHLKTTPKTAPSKLFKSAVGAPGFRTPSSSICKKSPSTVGRLHSKISRVLGSKPNPILRERNSKKICANLKPSPNGTTYTDFASELNTTARYYFRSSVLTGKRRAGSRISQSENNRSKRKTSAKSFRKSIRNTSKTTPNLTPARGKLGLPFLI